jgi:hypothetical protein
VLFAPAITATCRAGPPPVHVTRTWFGPADSAWTLVTLLGVFGRGTAVRTGEDACAPTAVTRIE